MLANLLTAGMDPQTTPLELVRRARLVTIASLLLAAIALPFVVQYHALGVPLMSGAVALTVVAALTNVAVLRRTRNVALAGTVGTLLLWALLVTSNIASGGFFDPNFGWFYVVPILGALIVSARAGWWFTGLVLLTTLAFWLAPRMGVTWEALVPEEQHAAQSLFNRLSAVLAIAGLVSVFSSAERFAGRRLAAAKADLETEVEVRRLAELEARHANEAKTDFLASMSHELRTPLNAIVGLSDLMLRDDVSDRQARHLRAVAGSGNALLGIISDILDFSEIRAGKLELRPQPASLTEFAAEMEAMFEQAARERGIGMSVEVDPTCPDWVDLDVERLRQVVVNLVGNALKFTVEGSVTVRMEREHDRVRFSVVDSGIGIAPEALEHLFDPFYRSPGATQRRIQGTGLGLAICARLAAMMGGELQVHSELGTGTEFAFTLPITEIAAPEQEHADGTLPTIVGPVLVVDDNPVNLMVARAMVEELGYEVVTAVEGLAAVRVALEQRPALILMDCSLPGIDGYEATRRIRHDGGDGYVPWIIALTAAAFPEDVSRSLASGMDDHLTKPIVLATLREALAGMDPPRVSSTAEASGVVVPIRRNSQG